MNVDVALLAAARTAVAAYDHHAEADAPGQGELWTRLTEAMNHLAALCETRPPVCPRCTLPVAPEQINVNGRHLACALHDGTLTVKCRACFDGRVLPPPGAYGQTLCSDCGRTRADG